MKKLILIPILLVIAIFALANYTTTRAEISEWLKKDDDPDYKTCNDREMACFLNGLIVDKRGPSDGPERAPEERLNNNLIFPKLKIALNLKAENVLEMVNQGDFRISKHELSAFFRKPGHKHYRECKDQALRNFLKGMQTRYRDKAV